MKLLWTFRCYYSCWCMHSLPFMREVDLGVSKLIVEVNNLENMWVGGKEQQPISIRPATFTPYPFLSVPTTPVDAPTLHLWGGDADLRALKIKFGGWGLRKYEWWKNYNPIVTFLFHLHPSTHPSFYLLPHFFTCFRQNWSQSSAVKFVWACPISEILEGFESWKIANSNARTIHHQMGPISAILLSNWCDLSVAWTSVIMVNTTVRLF